MKSTNYTPLPNGRTTQDKCHVASRKNALTLVSGEGTRTTEVFSPGDPLNRTDRTRRFFAYGDGLTYEGRKGTGPRLPPSEGGTSNERTGGVSCRGGEER